MIKQEIIEQVAQATGHSEHAVKTILESTIETIEKALMNGEPVILRGFGTFKVKKAASKLVRNISRGYAYVIPSRKVVKFEPGKDLKTK